MRSWRADVRCMFECGRILRLIKRPMKLSKIATTYILIVLLLYVCCVASVRHSSFAIFKFAFRPSSETSDAKSLTKDVPVVESSPVAYCGKPENTIDCRWNHYTLASVVAHTKTSYEYDYRKQKEEALQDCKGSKDMRNTGSWCIFPDSARGMIRWKTLSYPMARHHHPASNRIVHELAHMFRKEKVKSVSDLGAGIGQYGAALMKLTPDIKYAAYEGSGNVEEYTMGMVKWFDLSMPFTFEPSDWAISLEVGEHLPHRSEHIFLRNLHVHNCKGIILSWAVIGQQGHGHVNCHNNEYVIDILTAAGYDLDGNLTRAFRREPDYWWLANTVMVFRRRVVAC
jgi:hypothetical protein